MIRTHDAFVTVDSLKTAAVKGIVMQKTSNGSIIGDKKTKEKVHHLQSSELYLNLRFTPELEIYI